MPRNRSMLWMRRLPNRRRCWARVMMVSRKAVSSAVPCGGWRQLSLDNPTRRHAGAPKGGPVPTASGSPRASPVGLTLYPKGLFQGFDIEMGLGQQFLQPAVLGLHLAQTLDVTGLHPPVLGSPFVKTGIAEPMPPAQLRHRHTGVRFLDEPNDLRFGIATLFHLRLSLLGGLYRLSFGTATGGRSGAGHRESLFEVGKLVPQPHERTPEGLTKVPLLRSSLLTRTWP